MISFIIFLIGLFLGSFLNVLIDRIPRKETVIKGRSYCENCKKELKWYDLIPVFSFLILKGRCRFCKAKLSFYYPLVELITASVLVLTYYFFRNENFFTIIYYSIISCISIVIFFMDLKYGIIADKILFPAIGINLFYLLIFNPSNLIINLFSAFGTLMLFILITLIFYFFTKKIGFGGGDIKLAFLLGLFLGFPNVVVAVYTAFLTGAFFSIILIIWRKKRFFRDSLPFGPFLILGLLLSLFWGDFIIQRVGNLLGF